MNCKYYKICKWYDKEGITCNKDYGYKCGKLKENKRNETKGMVGAEEMSKIAKKIRFKKWTTEKESS